MLSASECAASESSAGDPQGSGARLGGGDEQVGPERHQDGQPGPAVTSHVLATARHLTVYQAVLIRAMARVAGQRRPLLREPA
ncbi:hypothetical protein ADK54_27615 [Streptomyces sp. WM6378]|nr:hypothetical protein ADK54_27615 [Streptomyces sp. WM6378]